MGSIIVYLERKVEFSFKTFPMFLTRYNANLDIIPRVPLSKEAIKLLLKSGVNCS